MNRTIPVLSLAIAMALATPVAQAEHVEENNSSSGNTGFSAQSFQDLLTGKNVGRAIGAGVGALLGSQVGGGDGKLAAVAVGTLAGFWLGGEAGDYLTKRDRVGIAETTHQALETGETRSWHNPDTGVATRVKVHERSTVKAPVTRFPTRTPVAEMPTLGLRNAFYRATTPSNVRSGPSTNHQVVGQLSSGERIAVVGKVKGEQWLMIADNGYGSGYVYAPLLSPVSSRSQSENALRIAASKAPSGGFQTRECARITQEIDLPNGTTEAKQMRACQRADGTWEAV